jgi:hypothetical protein
LICIAHASKLLSIGRLLQWARKVASCAAGFRIISSLVISSRHIAKLSICI